MTSDLEDKCSVCLQTGTKFNIFTTYNISNDKEELYVDLIKKCFNIEITLDSGLNAMCADCIIKLGTANNFKNDIIVAVQRLAKVAMQCITTTDSNADEKEVLQEDHLDNQFENDYDYNTILNPETGQISYTLDKINEVKDTTENEPDTYVIDMENDVIISRKEANRKVIKKKRKIDADVVKENIPGNIEKETKIRQRKRARKDVKKKDTVEVVNEKTPAIVAESKDNLNEIKNSREDTTEATENVVSVHIKDKIFINIKPRKPSNANKPPPFTLDPGQLDCKLCDATFETTKALSTHMNVHYPDYVCADCGMVFASERRLRVHRNQAHVEGPLVCKHCDKEFTNVNTRNAHTWRVHGKTDPFKCPQCDERFKTYLKRLRHVQDAHGNAVDYPCQYCDKKFAYAAYRTKHVRTVHLHVRPHACPACPLSFARRRELAAHRASRHGDGQMKYQCDICSKRFYFKTALKFHVNLHINRYSCNDCDAKFPKICQLEVHRASHPPQEPAGEGLQLDGLPDYSLDCAYWGLGEI